MEAIRSGAQSNRRAIALGLFDGVHLGHSALLSRLIEIKRSFALTPSVLTFATHPKNLLSGHSNTVRLLTSVEDRCGLIHRLFGIDDVIVLNFDKGFAEVSAEHFIEMLMMEHGAIHLIAGSDFRFGKGAKGDSRLLKNECVKHGISCDIVPKVVKDGIVISSTEIRKMLENGDVAKALDFLGHPHVLTDIVQHGKQIGRTIGIPTINMRFSQDVLCPAFGVYATKVHLEDGSEFIGVTNIGVRPTVSSEDAVTAETHLPHFVGDVYGTKVRIEFYKQLRPEIRFSDINSLKEQIHKDINECLDFFA